MQGARPVMSNVGPPGLASVPCELQVVALARHAGLEVADAAPGVEPAVERADGGLTRQWQERGADRHEQEPATAVKH